MSEYIGHVIFAQDAQRIVQRWPAVSRTLVEAIEAAPHALWLGSATSGGRHGLTPLMEALRARRPLAGEDLGRAAFAAGWVTHQASDGYLKQVYRGIIPEYHALEDWEKTPPSDARITHDVLMMRERADGGRMAPFAPSIFDYRLESHPAAAALDVTTTEAVMGLRTQRALLSLMSAEAMSADAPLSDRLDAYFNLLDPSYISTDRYADAATDADPELLRRFVHDIRFYDADDPLVRIAGGEGGDVEAALAAADAQGSLYARVLALSAQFLQLAGEVLDGRADLDALEPVLNVQPGRDGVPDVVFDASL